MRTVTHGPKMITGIASSCAVSACAASELRGSTVPWLESISGPRRNRDFCGNDSPDPVSLA
jgi:hypothetical protein